MTDTDHLGKVYIVGGGPGDPELLTLKAKRIIETADVVIYADSLVPLSVVDFARPGAEVHGSKTLTLPKIMELMVAAVKQGKTVARVQSGDPSIYGAVFEQMRLLNQEGIDFEIIPGVSSAFAAAAVLKAETDGPGGFPNGDYDPGGGTDLPASWRAARGPGDPRMHPGDLPQHHTGSAHRAGVDGGRDTPRTHRWRSSTGSDGLKRRSSGGP